MSKTIVLKSISGAPDRTIILSGDTLEIVGDQGKCRIDKVDATALLMFCEDIIRRKDQYIGLKTTTGE